MNSFNNDYGLLDLRCLASYFNERLGAKYRVVLNSLEYPEKQGRTVATLQAQRVPFAISNVRAETLTINLNFRLMARIKTEVMTDMQGLLGCQKFIINTYKEENGETVIDKTFNCNSYLDMQMPLSAPDLDTGDYMCDYQITGTVLVTDNEGGAIISNDIITELSVTPLTGEMRASNVLASVSAQVKSSKAVESFVTLNSSMVQPVAIAKANSYSILALNLGREIDYEIIRRIESSDLSILYVRRFYPDGSVAAKQVALTEGQTVEQAGAYCQYSITLQEV